jgi:hypothetical protein
MAAAPHHDHDHNGREHGQAGMHVNKASLNWLAFNATLHCLTGCSIGEILGLIIGIELGLGKGATILLAVILAFVFGYLLTMLPLRGAGLSWKHAVRLALASDTASIAVMEIVDNAIMLAIPGAMDAYIDTPLFWGSLVFALIVAGIVAYPVNRYLLARGRGHALVHEHHTGERKDGK